MNKLQIILLMLLSIKNINSAEIPNIDTDVCNYTEYKSCDDFNMRRLKLDILALENPEILAYQEYMSNLKTVCELAQIKRNTAADMWDAAKDEETFNALDAAMEILFETNKKYKEFIIKTKFCSNPELEN